MLFQLFFFLNSGIGATQGILIKGGEPLEAAHRIRTIVFDKTGTITQGRPSVVETRLFVDQTTNDHEWTIERMLAIASTAESGSEHPLGTAIRDHCKSYFNSERTGRCEEFNAVSGYGLLAKVSGIESMVTLTTKPNNNDKENMSDLLIKPVTDNEKHYTVLIGNREWLRRNNITVNDEIDMFMGKHEDDGHTAVLIAVDGKYML